MVYKSCHYQSLQYKVKRKLESTRQFVIVDHQTFFFFFNQSVCVCACIQANSSAIALSKSIGIGRLINTATSLNYSEKKHISVAELHSTSLYSASWPIVKQELGRVKKMFSEYKVETWTLSSVKGCKSYA